MTFDTCNACGKETEVRWLRLPKELGYDQLTELGQYYCKDCFSEIREEVLRETGKWNLGEFQWPPL